MGKLLIERNEHNSQGQSIKDVKLIEGVQRRATKLVAGMQDLQYDERLKQFGLMRLERRRVRSD